MLCESFCLEAAKGGFCQFDNGILRETGELLLGVEDDRGIFLGLSISGEDFMRTTSIFYLNLRSASTSA